MATTPNPPSHDHPPTLQDCRLVVQQYNSARGAVEEEEQERALEAAYCQEEEGGGGWADDEGGEVWHEAAGQPLQQQQQRWQAFQGEEDEVGAGRLGRAAVQLNGAGLLPASPGAACGCQAEMLPLL